MAFNDPLYLLLLVAAPLWLWGWRSRLRPPALGYSSLSLVAPWIGRGRARFSWLPVCLQAAALVLAVVAFARPQQIERGVLVTRPGVEMMLLVDISSSMAEKVLERESSNLEVAKSVVRDFTAARNGDRMGLIAFAKHPKLYCPLTTDLDALAVMIDRLKTISPDSDLDGTGLGAALAEAARRFTVSENAGSSGAEPASDRVVILLTDGEENQHRIDPLQAARLCAAERIRVHTVSASHAAQDGAVDPTRPGPDRALLDEVARITGGIHTAATSARDLEAVYGAIDALEKKPMVQENYVTHLDLYRCFLGPAALLLFAALLLEKTLFSRVP